MYNSYPYQPYQAYQAYQNYQPPIPQTYQQPSGAVQTPIVWITSEDAVRNYPVSPGGSVLFMNETEPYMYMKSADQLGKSTIIKKRLVDETEPKENNLKDYIKREEIESIIQDAVKQEVEKRMSEISFKPTKRKPVVVDEED